MLNLELVGYADYIIMNFSIKIIIALPPYREQPASQSIFIITSFAFMLAPANALQAMLLKIEN